MNKSVESLLQVKKKLEAVGKSLEPIGKDGCSPREQNLEDISEELNHLDGAKLNVSLAFGVASLYYTLLNVKGGESADHPVHSELNRIKKHVQKLNEISK